MAIAEEGWRLQVDTDWLARLLYCTPVHLLEAEQSLELLDFLSLQNDEGQLGSAIYDWEENGELGI